MTEFVRFRFDYSGVVRLTFKQNIDPIVVKRFTDIQINRGLLKEKSETGLNLPYRYEKVWFSDEILTEIDRILNKERFQKAKDYYLFFPATGHTFCPRTPIDTPGRPVYG